MIKIVIGWIVKLFFKINGEIKWFLIVCLMMKIIRIWINIYGEVINVMIIEGIIVRKDFKYGIKFKILVVIFNVSVNFKLIIL